MFSVLVAQLCPTPCDPVDCSPPVSSICVILQARTLERTAIPTSRGIFPTQGWHPGLLHCRQILYQLSHQGSMQRLAGRSQGDHSWCFRAVYTDIFRQWGRLGRQEPCSPEAWLLWVWPDSEDGYLAPSLDCPLLLGPHPGGFWRSLMADRCSYHPLPTGLKDSSAPGKPILAGRVLGSHQPDCNWVVKKKKKGTVFCWVVFSESTSGEEWPHHADRAPPPPRGCALGWMAACRLPGSEMPTHVQEAAGPQQSHALWPTGGASLSSESSQPFAQKGPWGVRSCSCLHLVFLTWESMTTSSALGSLKIVCQLSEKDQYSGILLSLPSEQIWIMKSIGTII